MSTFKQKLGYGGILNGIEQLQRNRLLYPLLFGLIIDNDDELLDRAVNSNLFKFPEVAYPNREVLQKYLEEIKPLVEKQAEVFENLRGKLYQENLFMKISRVARILFNKEAMRPYREIEKMKNKTLKELVNSAK